MNQFSQNTFIGSEEADLSPLRMGLGEFLTDDSFDFMAGLVGSSQLNFNLPQGY